MGDNAHVDKAVSVGNYLNLYLGQNQGVRLGESVVVSRKAHSRMPEKKIKGQIKILTNRDAGKTYLDFVEENQVVHIDVYHKPGDVYAEDVARGIYQAVYKYFLERDPQLKYAEDELYKMVAVYYHKIYIVTNQGKGLLYDLLQDKVSPVVAGEEGYDHVHILARLNCDEYYLVYVIAEAVEEVILASEVKLARVRNIVHGLQKQKEDSFAGYIKLPWKRFKGQKAASLPEKENVNQLIVKLAEKFGGVEEIEEFMESYSTNIFKRKGIDQQKKKWGDVEHYIEQLEELGILKDTPAGKILTRKGQELKEYIINHKCELETEIRRSIRKMPAGGSGRFNKLGSCDFKSHRIEYINRNKTVNNPQNWTGDLAVPESIVQAKKNSFFRGDSDFTIRKEDLHYYKKRTYVPVNVCILLDSSGSMAGEKRQAACYLAQHLLLSGKEKVAVVTFQERSSRVVVPFTRKESELKKGLATINPAGLTPMAHGIMKALELIKESRIKNPLLVLITDGVPNVPLWTLDAKADTLRAASFIAKEDIRLVCIGVASNRSFLEKVAEKGEGILYFVDDLNRDNLINIVRHEKKEMLKGRQMA
ncbi:magnesium chelatase subunit D [Thermosyntropha lipolytica DSM 11003]|uniref:Magnesium chelatase subunit D n=1 Tax=Thermosyntropha lipolytica DSM 11003 TaxID=1123382 RepID=A0A1M5MSA9_9FIRM|nr:VWA domain-containing protein [Thermosyntropha lipolytica]SHG80161.1 magnesium chelatase subunit D [Thermosyntropha lipolytica DSM 11003]